MKGSLVLLLAGLSLSALAFAPALVPPKVVDDEKFRLDPTSPNYGDGTGGGGFAIGLPDMRAGESVNVSWETEGAYDVRILPDGADGRAPHVTDVEPLFQEAESVEGNTSFTPAADGSYWLTYTVPEGGKLEKGTVYLVWDPPLQRAHNPIFVDMGVTLLVITLVVSGLFEVALRRRDAKRAVATVAGGHSRE